MSARTGDGVVIGPARIAVGGTADLVVAGATFGGLAVALKAARAGFSVAVVEPRTYPGTDAFAPYRPWMPADALRRPPELLRGWLRKACRPIPGGELALHPDGVKRGLEDAVLRAGVKLLYGAHPVGVAREGRRLAGVVVATKGGRRAMLARAVVDATEWGLVARLAGEPFGVRGWFPGIRTVRRTFEFTGCAAAGAGPVPGGRVREGFLGPRHRLLELEMFLPCPSADLHGLMAMELEARTRARNLVPWARRAAPALARAYFSHASFELSLVSPFRFSPPGRGEAAADPFRGAANRNLWVLGSAAAVPDEAAAARLLEPLAAARAGEALARGVIEEIRRSRRPSAARCAATCGKPPSGKAPRVVAREPAPPAPARIRAPAERVPVLADADVAVAGGGTGGAVAAPAAAEEGARTVLLEMHGGLGGTGTLGGVNTYWYGRKEGFTAVVDGRYRAAARALGATRDELDKLGLLPASGHWHVEGKMLGLLEYALRAGVDAYFRVMTVGALVHGRAVTGLLVATPDGLAVVRSRVVVDATGDGDVAAFAGGAVSYGAARDGMPMYASLGPIPVPGHPTNSFATWVDIADPEDATRFVLAGRRRFTGFDHGPYLAPRETRHVKGLYTVTLRDQLTFKRHRDVVAYANDGRDIKGLASADWAMWGLSCGKIDVEIPFRAVVPEKLDGLLTAGKAYSATHEGLALARMQSDMQNLGGAVGTAAAMACARGVPPRRVGVRELQAKLVRRGQLPRSVLTRRIPPERRPVRELRRMIRSLAGRELDYAPNAWTLRQDKPEAVALLCAAGRRIVPALKAGYREASGERRLLLARLLAWYGSRAGADALVERLKADLSGSDLPVLVPGRKGRHPPPDGTKMTRTCRLFYTLGLTRDPRALAIMDRIVRLLRVKPKDYADDNNGAFYYVQTCCLVAEHLGLPGAVPILARLHAKPGLHGLQAVAHQPGIMAERMGYLEVAIARAMARCGSARGAAILAAYLGDARRYLAAHARAELEAVTGRDFGTDPRRWRRWLATRRLRPRPWTARGE